MTTALGPLCCKDIAQTSNMLTADGVDVGCITLHRGCTGVCLNSWVLQTAYFDYRQQHGENAIEGENQ